MWPAYQCKLHRRPLSNADPDLCGCMSRRYVELATHFYNALNDIERYNVNLAWIKKDWTTHRDTGVAFLEQVKRSPTVLAEEVAQLFETSWLDRTYTSGSGEQTTCTAFRELFGRLTGVVGLSDVIMDCGLQRLCSYYPDCYALKAVNVENETMNYPDRSLRTYSHVIIPVYVRDLKRWLVQIVTVDMRNEPKSANRMTVTMYDSLGLTSYMTNLEKKWGTYSLPLLQAWRERDCTREKSRNARMMLPRTDITAANQDERGSEVISPKPHLCGPKIVDCLSEPENAVEFVLTQPGLARIDTPAEKASGKSTLPGVVRIHLLTPTQSESVSCGLYCLVQAFSYVSNNRQFETKKAVQSADLEVMWLRLIWEIVCNCDSVGGATYGDIDSVIKHVELDKLVNRVFVTNVKSQ